MALMGSVYSTIVMSLERYLRLCRVQTMSKKCGSICCSIVVLFPIIFYFPKFWEYRYQKFEHDFPLPINCSQYILEQRELSEIDNAIKWVSMNMKNYYPNSFAKYRNNVIPKRSLFVNAWSTKMLPEQSDARIEMGRSLKSQLGYKFLLNFTRVHISARKAWLTSKSNLQYYPNI